MDFPSEFDIPNGNLPCFPFAGSDGTAFANNLICKATDNSVWVQGNTKTSTGAIMFNVT